MLPTTPPYTSSYRIDHFFPLKPVLNAGMMIVFYIAHYWARRSTVSITSSCHPFDANSDLTLIILFYLFSCEKFDQCEELAQVVYQDSPSVVLLVCKLVWVRLGTEARFLDCQSGLLTDTPPLT